MIEVVFVIRTHVIKGKIIIDILKCLFNMAIYLCFILHIFVLPLHNNFHFLQKKQTNIHLPYKGALNISHSTFIVFQL